LAKKGTIKRYPCAVRLRRVNREEFEARWAQKARALQIDANWIEPGLKLKNFKLFATDMDSTFLNLETLDEMASFVGKGEEVAHITELAMQGKPNGPVTRPVNLPSTISSSLLITCVNP